MFLTPFLEGQGKATERTWTNAECGSDAQEAEGGADATAAFCTRIQTDGNKRRLAERTGVCLWRYVQWGQAWVICGRLLQLPVLGAASSGALRLFLVDARFQTRITYCTQQYVEHSTGHYTQTARIGSFCSLLWLSRLKAASWENVCTHSTDLCSNWSQTLTEPSSWSLYPSSPQTYTPLRFPALRVHTPPISPLIPQKWVLITQSVQNWSKTL